MILKNISVLFICLVAGQILLAQTKNKRLMEAMKLYHYYNMFDGAVLVAENGKVIYKDAFELANGECNIPDSADTKFMIGSVSKTTNSCIDVNPGTKKV